MSILKKIGQIASVVVVSAMLACPIYAADAATNWGQVVSLQAGWTIDRMLVFHGAPMKNPDNCSLVTNGYIIDESAPGHRTFYAMLLGALLNKREVALVILGCFENRPRIVSVSIR